MSREFRRLNTQIVQHANAGQWKKCAEGYKELYDMLRKVENFKSQDGMSRLWSLSGYTSIFIDEHERATEADITYIKAVSKDGGLPPEERALAGFSLGFILWLARRREDAMKAYKQVLKLIITEEQKKKPIIGMSGHPSTAGREFDD
ncbi:hypothetical protein CEUSTIGMA_g4369.t1 [Chlamydomonas eustigma]|uniref:Uncharacterized protein n=1 Tax=Chlamydomonas eustigma TaxID=1157962 RepID=A0A250X204_9CHLO|nr:hypothetical protein CEUSTIGMA_g4369.t1 [Chlamydomonas eustigma]|eukprot:GAX76922.1 hypothetical protein CEUSTIGMA_g4369.t1 [Chlamydomonas eustigma]